MKQTVIHLMFGLFVMMGLVTAYTAQLTAAPPTAATIPATATAPRLTPTAVPLTAPQTLSAPSATPELITRTPPLAKDARGFSILEAEHATILSQPGVSDARASEVVSAFEVAYQVVGGMLGYPEKRPQLYVYRSEDELLQDLITTWQYPEWYKTSRAYPRMSRDFVTWIPPLPKGDSAFVAHEYSHRIIEQIAGIGSQFRYKWFDEGLAEQAGLEALARQSPTDAQAKKRQWIAQVISAHQAGQLIRFKDLTTEEQLAGLIQAGSGNLAYPQMAVAMDFLINRNGIVPVKNVLSQVGQGVAFSDAFQKVYGFTVDAFENEFLAYVVNLQGQMESVTCFTIDGQADDWQKLKPVIVDEAYPPIPRAADVRQVYAATCQGALYVMVITDAPANTAGDITYALGVDLNGDDEPEYQPGFERGRAWVWNLAGMGYADQKNLTFLSDNDYQAAIGQVAEFMLPLSFLNNAQSPRIRIHTSMGNQGLNMDTVWGQVQPRETAILAVATAAPAPATATLVSQCFAIDGQADDWQKLKPVIVDEAYPPIPRAADVRQVYAATCRGALYLMIVTDGPADQGSDIEYSFHVDLTGDDTPEYQPGFSRTRAWIWNLKGTGYADAKSNLQFLTAQDYRVAIGTVAEFMMPLSFLENATSLRMRVYTVVGGQMQNRQTVWAKVQPLEAQ